MTRRFAGVLACGGLLLFANAGCTKSSQEIQNDELNRAVDSQVTGARPLFQNDANEVFRMGGAGLRPQPPTVRDFGPTVPARPAPMTNDNPYQPQRMPERGVGGSGGTQVEYEKGR